MKKILICLISLAMITLSGSVLAWDVGINIGVEDAEIDITATATTENYALATSAGVDGTGTINIHGQGDSDNGYMMTSVSGQGELYASQGMGVAGCLVDCEGELCDECTNYEYGAVQFATIDGVGQIVLTEVVGQDTSRGSVNGQILIVKGIGDFKAGMMSSLWVEGMEETVDHAMGAVGESVAFCSFGIHGMDDTDGANAGFFTTDMYFIDEGCEGDECPEPEPETSTE